tara:strand:+ start:847 stop:1194 length:348 start_codon:yes stop_codon:yes gene_type:complete
MADTKKDTKAMEGFLKELKKEQRAIKKKYPGAEGDKMIRDLFVKVMPKPKAASDKKVRTVKKVITANKGGMAMAMKKKTKYMAKGGAMKKTKYMAKGGAMKKTKYMARGGAVKRK